jgi:hypothetical protein
MITVRYGQPTPTVPGRVRVPISAAYSGGLLFTIPVEIDDTGDIQKNEDAASARLCDILGEVIRALREDEESRAGSSSPSRADEGVI